MSKAKNSNPSEEVDLGQLFKMIGSAFTRLYKFIGSIFNHFFLAFVWLVFFVKKRIIILSAAGFLGLIAGHCTDWGVESGQIMMSRAVSRRLDQLKCCSTNPGLRQLAVINGRIA